MNPNPYADIVSPDLARRLAGLGLKWEPKLLDFVTCEFLDAWSAEWLGWHRQDGFWLDAQGHRRFYADDSAHHFDEDGLDYWHPTAEGSEHQAVMAVRKMDTQTCKMEMSFYGGVADVSFLRVRNGIAVEELGRARGNFGPAILLAAWRAVEGVKE